MSKPKEPTSTATSPVRKLGDNLAMLGREGIFNQGIMWARDFRTGPCELADLYDNQPQDTDRAKSDLHSVAATCHSDHAGRNPTGESGDPNDQAKKTGTAGGMKRKLPMFGSIDMLAKGCGEWARVDAPVTGDMAHYARDTLGLGSPDGQPIDSLRPGGPGIWASSHPDQTSLADITLLLSRWPQDVQTAGN
ncbi:hypothetical protein SAMD00023353_2200660 [Rosellinia necatrix]|uniref:Uncharacterized protein n=1 Tax=Rosellinia necatrix TaxID=77044 RepID=A0A1S8A7Q9_ROSNE|nr:hypothetical protein SAMD00023353_2200660 [Rosellinia necatrix]